MSFFVDWWLLIIFGIACALVSRLKRFYRKDGFLFYYLCAIVLVVFYAISVSMLSELDATDNPVLGSMNEVLFALMKGDRTSVWGELAALSPFKQYYDNLIAWSSALGLPAPTSTEFMFSSGFEFIKCGADGVAVSNLGGTLVPFPREWISPIWLNTFPFSGGVPFNNLETLAKFHPMYLFGGICFLCCYPAFLYIGTQMGYLLFGRKPGDKGIIYLL